METREAEQGISSKSGMRWRKSTTSRVASATLFFGVFSPCNSGKAEEFKQPGDKSIGVQSSLAKKGSEPTRGVEPGVTPFVFKKGKSGIIRHMSAVWVNTAQERHGAGLCRKLGTHLQSQFSATGDS